MGGRLSKSAQRNTLKVDKFQLAESSSTSQLRTCMISDLEKKEVPAANEEVIYTDDVLYATIDFAKTYALWKTMDGGYQGGGRQTRHDAINDSSCAYINPVCSTRH